MTTMTWNDLLLGLSIGGIVWGLYRKQYLVAAIGGILLGYGMLQAVTGEITGEAIKDSQLSALGL